MAKKEKQLLEDNVTSEGRPASPCVHIQGIRYKLWRDLVSGARSYIIFRGDYVVKGFETEVRVGDWLAFLLLPEEEDASDGTERPSRPYTPFRVVRSERASMKHIHERVIPEGENFYLTLEDRIEDLRAEGFIQEGEDETVEVQYFQLEQTENTVTFISPEVRGALFGILSYGLSDPGIRPWVERYLEHARAVLPPLAQAEFDFILCQLRPWGGTSKWEAVSVESEITGGFVNYGEGEA